MRLLFIALITTFFSYTPPIAEVESDVFVPISKYIKSGDAERLSAWFASTLEVEMLGNSNVCSKQQAKRIMKEFFNEYSPKEFEVTHRSGKVPMRYAIGNLVAGGSKFRITLHVKIGERGNFIHHIRVEKE